MMADMEKIRAELPGIDCGSCGAPNCMAFAEDIVKGETNADECVVNMRMLFHDFLEKRRDGTPGDILPLEKWVEKRTKPTETKNPPTDSSGGNHD